MNVIKDTPVKVSTMTIVSSLGSEIDLGKIYDRILLSEDLVSVEFGDKPIRGENKKKTMKRRSKAPRKAFYNQSTFLYHDKSKANGRPVNVKVFNNGSCQMTGVQSLSSVTEIMNKIISSFKNIDKKEGEENVLKTPEEMRIGEIKICLINSGFSIKRKVNRANLHEICNMKNIHADYEPSIYPAVNIKYYLNNDNTGVCDCQCICDGKGSGYDDNQGTCKRITIAVFESGEVLICGRITENEIKKVYHFINDIFNKNKEIFD